MSEQASTRNPCVVCAAPLLVGEPWILLNRWALGTGVIRACIETTNAEGEHIYDVSDDPDHEDIVTGPAMHWPVCAGLYIDAKMAQWTVEGRARGWETPR